VFAAAVIPSRGTARTLLKPQMNVVILGEHTRKQGPEGHEGDRRLLMTQPKAVILSRSEESQNSDNDGLLPKKPPVFTRVRELVILSRRGEGSQDWPI